MEITYSTRQQVGHLEFSVHNGAMDLTHCQELLELYTEVREEKNTNVIVLWGGEDFFSNGIDLNSIHLQYNSTILAYKNLKALNKLIEAVLQTTNKLVIAALRGSAAAGGVMLALAADLRYARKNILLNPSYVNMGLSGSEYWSILLPSMVGFGITQKLIYEATPISSSQAAQLGLVQAELSSDQEEFAAEVTRRAEFFSQENIEARLAAKEVLNHRLLKDMEEQVKLELLKMKDSCNHQEFETSRTIFVEKKKCKQKTFPSTSTSYNFANSETDSDEADEPEGKS